MFTTTRHQYWCSILPICCYNISGSVRDSKVAEELGDVFFKLGTVYDSVGKWKARRQFCLLTQEISRLSCQVNSTGSLLLPFMPLSLPEEFVERTGKQLLRSDLPSGEQCGPFSRRFLVSGIVSYMKKLGKRRRIISKMMILLYNHCARFGWYCPKIKNTFMLALYVNAITLYVV